MKRIVCLMLCFVMMIGMLASCQQKPEGEETTPAPEETTLPPFEGFEGLSLAGADIKQYTIVYAQSPFAAQMANDDFGLFDNADFDKQTAKALASLIKKAFGAELSVVCDDTAPVGEYEILVGLTNRAESKKSAVSSLKSDQFLLRMDGKKLVVCGGEYGTTWHAAEAFSAWLTAEAEARNTKPNLEKDLSGTYRLKRVALIGDSLTYGDGSTGYTSTAYFTYPAQLQRMMWKDYLFFNYGECGKTMRYDSAMNQATTFNKTGKYKGSETYTKLMGSSESFDLVVIMLGTNDTKVDTSWSSPADDTLFKNAMADLVSDVKKKSSNAEFIIMTAPKTNPSNSSSFALPFIVGVQKAGAAELKNKGEKVSLFDMRAYTEANAKAGHFKDSVHYNDLGYQMLAKGVKEAIEAHDKGVASPYYS